MPIFSLTGDLTSGEMDRDRHELCLGNGSGVVLDTRVELTALITSCSSKEVVLLSEFREEDLEFSCNLE